MARQINGALNMDSHKHKQLGKAVHGLETMYLCFEWEFEIRRDRLSLSHTSKSINHLTEKGHLPIAGCYLAARHEKLLVYITDDLSCQAKLGHMSPSFSSITFY